jgi:hypothetical protein
MYPPQASNALTRNSQHKYATKSADSFDANAELIAAFTCEESIELKSLAANNRYVGCCNTRVPLATFQLIAEDNDTI